VNRHTLTYEELVDKLKKMIVEEKKLDLPTEAKPPADFSNMQRCHCPTFGTVSAAVKALDTKRQRKFETAKSQVQELLSEKAMKKEGKLFKQLQPIIAPSWEALVGERIDVLYAMQYSYEDDEGNEITEELRWCQGKVLSLVSEANEVAQATFEVEWDPMSDLKGDYEESSVSSVTLKLAKFNKSSADGWRLDLDLVVGKIDFVDLKVDMKAKLAGKKEEGDNKSDNV